MAETPVDSEVGEPVAELIWSERWWITGAPRKAWPSFPPVVLPAKRDTPGSGNTQQPIPVRLDQANGLVQHPSIPHSYRARAAKTVQQPILAAASLRPPTPLAQRVVGIGLAA
jgi:hypothetical protein